MHSHKRRLEYQMQQFPEAPAVSSVPNAWHQRGADCEAQMTCRPATEVQKHLEHVLAAIANDSKILRACHCKPAILKG